jgi:hypothetical protein
MARTHSPEGRPPAVKGSIPSTWSACVLTSETIRLAHHAISVPSPVVRRDGNRGASHSESALMQEEPCPVPVRVARVRHRRPAHHRDPNPIAETVDRKLACTLRGSPDVRSGKIVGYDLDKSPVAATSRARKPSEKPANTGHSSAMRLPRITVHQKGVTAVAAAPRFGRGEPGWAELPDSVRFLT